MVRARLAYGFEVHRTLSLWRSSILLWLCRRLNNLTHVGRGTLRIAWVQPQVFDFDSRLGAFSVPLNINFLNFC